MPAPAEPTGELDAERILRSLADHGVDYVLVGGLAVQTHGHTRTTFDVDIIPSPDPENLTRLATALREMGATALNPGPEGLEIEAAMLPRAMLWQFRTRHGQLDLLHDAPGAAPYEQLKSRALLVSLGGLEVAVAGRDDLISMKRARGRPVDLDDLAVLTQLPAGGDDGAPG